MQMLPFLFAARHRYSWIGEGVGCRNPDQRRNRLLKMQRHTVASMTGSARACFRNRLVLSDR